MLAGRRWVAPTAGLLSAGLAATVPAPSQADEIGHYAPGLISIRDYVMPAEPGVYSSLYTYYYSTDRLNDSKGHEIDEVDLGPGPGLDLDVDVDVFVVVPSILWVSPWKILGARYGAYIAPSIANSSVNAALESEIGRGVNPSESNVGFGDLYVQPVWLDWGFQHWDIAVGYGFYAPTGRYDVDAVDLPIIGDVKVEDTDNIGLGYWTHQFQASVAWYPMDHRGTAVTAAATYEINGDKKDFDFRAGDRISINLGVSQYLPLTADGRLLLEFGPAGYSQWQVSDDTGSDAKNGSDHDQTHAIGAQLGITVAPWNAALNFHYFHELASEDRFEGDVLGLNFAAKW